MRPDVNATLGYHSSDARLQHILCGTDGRPHRFARASRPHRSLLSALRSRGQDAAVDPQSSLEVTPQENLEATPRSPGVHSEPAADQGFLSSFSRRDLIRGVVISTVATGAPALIPSSLGTPSAQAIPTTSRLPPIGQAAPGIYNLGVAAVRDPALYRLAGAVQYLKHVL